MCPTAHPYGPSTYPAGAPAGVHGSLPGSALLARYPAPSFWLPTPGQLPGAPCTYPAEAPTTFFRQAAPVRLPGVLEWSANARPIDIYS